MTTAGGDVDMRESYSSYLERSVAGDEMTDALPDIDLYDHDNPLAVTEYVNDIYDYWYRVEVRMCASTALRRAASRRVEIVCFVVRTERDCVRGLRMCTDCAFPSSSNVCSMRSPTRKCLKST
jgi:hypothetical protein